MSTENTRRAGPAAHLARHMTPWGFPILYLGWAFLFWIPIVISEDPVWSLPNIVLLFVGGLSPLVAGLPLLWFTQGQAGYRDLWQRLTEIGRISARWWLVIVLFYPVYNLLLAGAALHLGITSEPLEFITTERLFDPTAFLLLIALALLFPAIEEIGLRGYWFDQLQARWNALASTLIFGAVWATWHVPLLYMAGYYEATTFDPQLWWFWPMILLTAFIGTWIYNNTARSVLAVIGIHFVGNFTGETMGFGPDMYPFVAIGLLVVVLLLLAIWGPSSLRGNDIPRPLAPEVERRGHHA